MKLLVIILNKTEALEYLLEGMSAAGISGATIIPSSGMAMTLSKMNSSFISSSGLISEVLVSWLEREMLLKPT